MSCPCDISVFPQPLHIPAGLGAGAFQRARALGLFPEWRLSVLAAVGREPRLDAWRAREPHDLGLMLAEMGAYVFDVCDFYDALVAGESFLRTAQLTGAQRRLVALLGYLPRPASGALAYLAAEADGRRVVSLPARVAFRSGEFDGNPPQVFELTRPASLDPRINRLAVERVPENAITGATLGSLLVDPGSLRVRPGQPIVLDFAGSLRTARVSGVAPVALRARTPAARLSFAAAVSVPAGATYSGLRLLAPGGASGLWKLGQIGADTEKAIDGAAVLLGSLASVQPGDVVLFEKQGTLEARRVSATTEHQRTLFATLTSTIKDTTNTVTGSVESPPIKVAVSKLTLEAPLAAAAWSSADADRIVVHHPLGIAARVLVPLKDTLAVDDPVSVPALIDPPRVDVDRLLLEDVHQEGVATVGSLDVGTHRAVVGQGEDWGKTLTAAVTLFANVLTVSRGESVLGEGLGMGDGSEARQTFKLKKKPLTYLPAATASGLESTLAVRVGGVLWRGVESFYGATDADRVYIVRHDDDGEAFVTFGGGARLPTGAAVTADYRYGAGAAVPPAGSIAQLAKPFPGLTGVRNVLPAFGGGDAEPPRELAFYAPRSALLLGRAISLPDLEAAAATVAGVRAARAMWRWDEAGLRAVAQVQYIGSEQLREAIRARLRALTEPDAPIAVVRALPQNAVLALAIEVNPDFLAANVVAAVRDALHARPELPDLGGLLRPERLGPEGIVFLSQIAAAVMAVAGVAGIQSVSFNGTPFVTSGRKPALGHYFDFGEPGTPSSRIVINGVASEMPIARDDYREYLDEKLWQWLPAIYREMDEGEGAGAFRSFVKALATQAALLKRNQDRVWDDGYVELASDWAIPYLADLVATRLVSALNLRARRVDVAKTIYYRRRKGTLLVLEQLIADMTGWDGKVVEEFRRLARAHHGLDGLPRTGRLTGTPEGGFADLRSVRGALLTGDAFDELHYTPDARRPRGLSGRRGIPKLSFHEFRLHPVHLVGVRPRRLKDFAGPRDGFTFDPSGRDIALFGTDQSHPSGAVAPDAQGDWSEWRPAAEWQLPRPMACRLLGESVFEIGDAQIGWVRTTPLIATQPQRDAAADDLRKIAGERLVGRATFARLLRGLPSGAVLTTPGVLAQLTMRALVRDCGAAALLPNGADVASWPGPIVPAESSFDRPAVSVRFAGADPVARSATRSARLDAWAPPVMAGVKLFVEPERGRFVLDHDPFGVAAVRVDYHVGMLAPIGAGAFGREVEASPPTTSWAGGAFGAGTPANGIAQVEDSLNYVDPPDQLAAVACTVRAAEQQRPYVVLDAANWRFGAAGANATLRLDGLWIGARAPRVLRLEGNFERVRLRAVTLDPGGLDAAGGVLPAVALVIAGFVEKLVIDCSVLASIRLDGAAASVERLVIRDSIVHARDAGVVAINLPSATVRMARTTVMAPAIDDLALRVEELDATDSLVAGVAKVANTQQGCFRFSARGPQSTVPHPYRSHVVDDLGRLFASRRFGDHRYAQLSPVAPAEIVRGAEDGSEIGAFSGARVAIEQDSLEHKVDEYMPFGRIPNFIVEN